MCQPNSLTGLRLVQQWQSLEVLATSLTHPHVCVVVEHPSKRRESMMLEQIGQST